MTKNARVQQNASVNFLLSLIFFYRSVSRSSLLRRYGLLY